MEGVSTPSPMMRADAVITTTSRDTFGLFVFLWGGRVWGLGSNLGGVQC
jgi:hypothetical protein